MLVSRWPEMLADGETGAGATVGLRAKLISLRLTPLRSAFVARAADRGVVEVLRVAARPDVRDALTAALERSGVGVAVGDLSGDGQLVEVVRGLPKFGAVVVDAAAVDDVAPCLQLLTRVTNSGSLLVTDVPEGSELATGLRALQAEWEDPTRCATEPRRRLAKALAAVETSEVRRGHFDAQIAITRPLYLRLLESEANAHLRRNPEVGRVLETIAAADLVNRASIDQSPTPVPHKPKSVFAAPELSLRVYNNVTAFPRQIVARAGVVLPDSFRKPTKSPPAHRTLGVATHKIVVRPSFSKPEKLAGTYFYLDSEYRGHFGHAITEQLSRLWAWQSVKEQEPDAKCLLAARRRNRSQPQAKIHEFERALYGAAGVDPDDLVLVSGPVRVKRLYAATPMFAQPAYAHPEIAGLWREVGDRLAAQVPDRQRPRRIFCGRKHDKRACHNGIEVERLFERHGFTVIYPEDYSMGEQVALFREADVVAGYAGSALFTLMFCPEPKHLIMISSESYRAENEYTIAAVLGHRISVAWCRPDLEREAGRGFDRKTFQSRYTFDFEREGAFVDEVLAEL